VEMNAFDYTVVMSCIYCISSARFNDSLSYWTDPCECNTTVRMWMGLCCHSNENWKCIKAYVILWHSCQLDLSLVKYCSAVISAFYLAYLSWK